MVLNNLKEKMKNIKLLILIIFCLFLIVIVTCFIFYREFNRLNNPIMAGLGLMKMKIFNLNYVLIQENPKVIIAKSNNALNRLEKYMDNYGFKLIEQLGSWVIFENDLSEKQSFSFRVNRYYSIWEW